MLEGNQPHTYPHAVNAKLVERLARLEPRDSLGIAQDAGDFVQIHSNSAFGWHIARAFARARLRFPVTVIGRDHWLFSAYLMHLDPVAYRRGDIETAFQISQQPGLSAKLKAMLMTGLGDPIDAHLNLVAEKTGIPRLTVEAFEILFFNVLDRHQDGLYLSSLAYPDGCLVELDEDYFETTPIADLILRAAYNHRDIELVSRLAGMTEADCKKELTALRNLEAKLEARIFGNAQLIAQTGLLNQPSVGLQRATQLLASGRSRKSKTAEAESQTPHDIAGELAAALAAIPPITDADRRELRAAARPSRSYLHDDEGNITACDFSDVVPPASQAVAGPPEPLVMFPEPITAIWRNKDFDQPVTLIGRMSAPGFADHYLTAGKNGIPVSEVFFEN
ncbi:MAG: hypothetical protein RLZZ214_70 [Verrucomicrobiota bacterium]|jgi:hypothetical protein